METWRKALYIRAARIDSARVNYIVKLDDDFWIDQLGQGWGTEEISKTFTDIEVIA